MTPILLRGGRIVPVDGHSREPGEPVDLLLEAGRVTAVGFDLTRPPGAEEVALNGRFVIPGLWDHHVHMSQWAATLRRVDLSGTTSPQDVIDRVRTHLATLDASGVESDSLITGWGHRSGTWNPLPSVAALDAVSGRHPIVLMSGDGHNGWLNSTALALVGLEPRATPLEEDDWFPVWPRVSALHGSAEQTEAGFADAMTRAAAAGIVGITDLEFDAATGTWPARYAAGLDSLRVRVGVYAEQLDRIIAEGRRTGDPWEGTSGLATMGPFKVISDGSLGTRSAHCYDPYPVGRQGDSPRGKQNISPDNLTKAMTRATANGLDCAIHAIGDAAMDIALDAYAATGARGTIEHAQLTTEAQIARMAALGIRASVQPAHLLDDRDLTSTCWPGREERTFMFRSMLDAGVRLELGSDAPVSPLDPWLAMAATVHRSADDRAPWTPEQALTAAEALAASTGGWGTVAVGHPADLAVLDSDPLAAPAGDTAVAAQHLRTTRVAVTVVDGRVVHDAR
ncbi:MAG: amidohydrolase family protein [Nostocoides sp.]